jgi:tRNA nucleotidyltransferase (CCA-adding enzyme)
VLPGSPERSLHDFLLHSCGYDFPYKRLKDIDTGAIKRLIVVDTRQKSRIGAFAEVAARSGVEVIVYDHHPATSDDLVDVDKVEVADVGAVVTLMTEKLRAEKISLVAADATLMLIGLYEDTGSLTFKGTTGRDFQAASWLLEQGGNLETVAGVINNPLDREQISLLNDLLSSQRILYPHGQKVVLVEAGRDHYIPDVAMVVHRLRDIEGYEVVIARHGFPWGYLRAKVYDCYIEGILRFRQKVVYFKPMRVEGECRLYSAQADAIGAPRGGVGAVEPEEVGW